jgi:hypothetical protein
MALSTGAVPLMTATTMQAWRTGFDVFNALTRVAASRTIPQTLASQRRLADTVMRGAAAPPAAATARLAHRALAPVHRKATANVKRLTKKAR